MTEPIFFYELDEQKRPGKPHLRLLRRLEPWECLCGRTHTEKVAFGCGATECLFDRWPL